MSPIRAAARAGLVAAAAVLLSGCISLFPKSDPAQLYRFGAAQADQIAQPGPGLIARGPIGFDSSAATDRILTVTGNDAAYIESARWVSSAPVLFEEAVSRAFESTPGAPRLVGRGSIVRATHILNLDVQAFEARYDQGPEAAPQVVVRIRATLVNPVDRTVAGEQLFTATRRASENRVGPIVAAFDGAVQDALAKLVAWTASPSA